MSGRSLLLVPITLLLAMPVSSKPASSPTAPLVSTGIPTSLAFARRFVLALDPGHGGSNLGAALPGSEIFEKRITLELARRVQSALLPAGDIDVVLCRDQDILVPIRARARCAEEARADLFVSLHANASPPGMAPGVRRGFEVYVLSPQEVEDDVAVALLGQSDQAEAAWAGHRIRAAAEFSVVAARTVDSRLKEALGARGSRGIRQTGAALDVLRGTGAPAILVEVGFLDHPEEGPALASPETQDRIAGALARAVLDLRAATTATTAATSP